MADLRHFGRYEVVQELGRGGMAVVYLAMDSQVKRLVAIKVLAPHFLSDKSLAERFEREASAIAALEHSAIVPLYDHGEQDGQRYLVFRYMEGGSLAERLAARRQLPLATVVPIAERIGAALTYAHIRGIIHRDVKPGNVLFDRNGEAWLSDFGIASVAEGASTLTGTSWVGTPLYVSPEQALGRSATAASDTYSFGVMLFEVLTGRPPFTAEHPGGLLHQHAFAEPPDALSVAPELSVSTSNVLARALAKDPATRWTTPLALAQTLARSSVPAGPDFRRNLSDGPISRAPRPAPGVAGRARRRRWLGAALAAVIVGATVGAAMAAAPRLWGGEPRLPTSGPRSPDQATTEADSPLSAQDSVTPSPTSVVRVAFTDPFQFCQYIDTIDWPVQNHPGGEAYVGSASPFSTNVANPVAWRCWAGIVLGCYAGASGGPCLKVDSRTEPSAELLEWCRAHPNEPPPYAVTGHNNAYRWDCSGSRPQTSRTVIPAESIDGLDYAIGPWFEIKQ